MSEQRANFLSRAVEWLRAGYQSGVPRQDYVALLGLLRRNLTEDEIRNVAQDLADQSVFTDEPVTTDDIERLVRASALQPASPDDIVRVSAHRAAGRWPLADPPAD